ncbi:hypothetical protein M3194_15635 [Paenibacillus glycanilyticus]|uniref:hypothetical protein n=1 Tax=Paenibacillus glycanilyticus TaxID=126569 RepID=UPI002041DB9E|nr:hypothetical protein [Paenibacillus glycanilyticus]MCM3628775.1 hypothetical protein [Paenibacillus glycanilyticus]
MSYPVVLLKNGDLLKSFNTLTAAHNFLLELTEGTEIPERLWDVINHGIDDHKSWSFEVDAYEFRSTKEARDLRANRLTRKI